MQGNISQVRVRHTSGVSQLSKPDEGQAQGSEVRNQGWKAEGKGWDSASMYTEQSVGSLKNKGGLSPGLRQSR